MVVVCAWCCRVLKRGQGPISHGICIPCRRRVEAAHAPLRDIAPRRRN